MNHEQVTGLDLAIVGIYLVVMVVVGVITSKKIKNSDDYYLAGRSFGPIVLMATVCATIIGGSGLMGRAGVAYSSGFIPPYYICRVLYSSIADRWSGFALPVCLLSYVHGLLSRRIFR